MRVALLHFCFEDYTIELANALVEQVGVTLIHPEKVSAVCREDLDPRIVIRSFKKPRIRDLRNFWAMAEMMQIIREVQPDVLHVQDPSDPWPDLTLFWLNKLPPLVITIHDVFLHPGDRQSPLSYTNIPSFYRAQQIIVHANALKQSLTQTFRVPSSRVSVLAHGELGSLYQRRRGQETRLPREPHTLLFFGRIWPYKGLKYLLEAMPLVAERIPDVKLIIAGHGEALEHYFPNGYDVKRYEILNDFIPVADVARLFQRSALTVLPYIESSQSGVAALSYGMGTPVVASRVGGLSEMIRHGEDGFLVPPQDVPALADAIIQVLSNPDLQHRLQTGTRTRCQSDLKWSTIAAQTVELYQRVIECVEKAAPQVQRV